MSQAAMAVVLDTGYVSGSATVSLGGYFSLVGVLAYTGTLPSLARQPYMDLTDVRYQLGWWSLGFDDPSSPTGFYWFPQHFANYLDQLWEGQDVLAGIDTPDYFRYRVESGGTMRFQVFD